MCGCYAVLLFPGKLEAWINTLPQNLLITITLSDTSSAQLKGLEDLIKVHSLGSKRMGITKSEGCINVALQLRGRAGNIAALQQHLLELDHVKGFY